MADRSVILSRTMSRPDGTFGTWLSDSGLSLITLELPWRDNSPDVSCIPLGRYKCTWRWSQAHGCNLYHIENVPGRSNCEIRSANVAQQLKGCIAPGNVLAEFPVDSISPLLPAHLSRGVTRRHEAFAALLRHVK